MDNLYNVKARFISHTSKGEFSAGTLNGNDLTDVLKNNRDMLMLIRNGSMRHGNKFTEEFYERVRDFENLLEKAYQNSPLPDTVDVKKASGLLVEMNKEFLKGEICCD